ncbi:MAG: threonine synthase [Spirochaetaceae bacterium]|jgi:threonine synthase|nr:threonine synthase [Spirochaetaceae bacterium]
MQFRSTKSAGLSNPPVSFKEAILRALPREGGLYVPTDALDMRQFFLYMGAETTYPELVSMVAPVLLEGELNPFSAARVAESAFAFEPEILRLDERFSVLTLYNGPTGIFKDFGVSFLASVMEELTKNDKRIMVLSASRGDTGVGIARAFYQRRNMVAALLYPSGPIRGLSPETFVPNGGNSIPIEVRGTYDDCQRLVIEIIEDRPFAERYSITTANGLNPGRLLPQAFYYLYAFIKLKKILQGDLFFSVPCGNFGNLISGLYAWKFGLPVRGFVAAANANDACGDFFKGKAFRPRRLISTVSPALDVTVPSNYERLYSFYEEAPAVMRNMVYPSVIGDRTTLATIERVWKRYGLLLDPHSAVAFAGAEQCAERRDMLRGNAHFVILATGHPAKEAAIVSKAAGAEVAIPEKLANLQVPGEPVAVIDPHIDALEAAIASIF